MFSGLLCTTGVGLGAALIFTGVNVFHIPANSIMKSTTDQIFAIRDKLEAEQFIKPIYCALTGTATAVSGTTYIEIKNGEKLFVVYSSSGCNSVPFRLANSEKTDFVLCADPHNALLVHLTEQDTPDGKRRTVSEGKAITIMGDVELGEKSQLVIHSTGRRYFPFLITDRSTSEIINEMQKTALILEATGAVLILSSIGLWYYHRDFSGLISP